MVEKSFNGNPTLMHLKYLFCTRWPFLNRNLPISKIILNNFTLNTPALIVCSKLHPIWTPDNHILLNLLNSPLQSYSFFWCKLPICFGAWLWELWTYDTAHGETKLLWHHGATYKDKTCMHGDEFWTLEQNYINRCWGQVPTNLCGILGTRIAWYLTYSKQTSIAIPEADLNLEVLSLAMHITTTFQTQANLLSIMFKWSEICWRRNRRREIKAESTQSLESPLVSERKMSLSKTSHPCPAMPACPF